MYTKKDLALLVIITAVLLLATGCGYSQQKGSPAASTPSSGGAQKVSPTVEATFASIQQNIFNPQCVVCHNAVRASAGISLASLSDIQRGGVIIPGNPSGSLLVQEIESGRMPQGGNHLAQNEIDAVKLWIQNGANP